MKNLLHLAILLLFSCICHAQTINFPTYSTLKEQLVTSNQFGGITYNSAGQHFKADVNNDHQIQYSEALDVYEIRIDGPSSFQDLTGLQYFTNLRVFECKSTTITTFNLQPLTNLEEVIIFSNPQLQNVNLQGLPLLKKLKITQTALQTLNLTGLVSLVDIDISHNSLNSSINLTNFVNLKRFKADYNGLHNVIFSGATNVEDIVLLNNMLSSIDLSGMENSLINLNLRGNLIGQLNLNNFIKLKTLYCTGNNLTQLNIQTLQSLENLDCSNNHISSINPQGLLFIKELLCSGNNLTNLNIQGLTTLENVAVYNNHLVSLNPSGLPLLKFLHCYNNNLTTLSVSGTPNLQYLQCYNNQLTQLLVNGMQNLIFFNCSNNLLTHLDLQTVFSLNSNCSNNNLSTLLIKNGKIDSTIFSGNPQLSYICTDSQEVDFIQTRAAQYGLPPIEISAYCNDVPLPTNTLRGVLRFYPSSANVSGSGTPVNQVKILDNGGATQFTYTHTSGNYSFPIGYMNSSLTPKFENPELFYSPQVNYNIQSYSGQIYDQDIAFWPIGVSAADLEVIIVPRTIARPGGDSVYDLVVHNKGNLAVSAQLKLNFDDSVLDFVAATPVVTSQQPNVITWNTSTVQPFETKIYQVRFNVNTPMETPPVNAGHILDYTATTTLNTGVDYFPSDNTKILHQTVVNSFDPNDKTCLEGSIIPPSQAGKYVNYIIRFENTGNASAERVIVTDVIDANKYDISSVIPLTSSHGYVLRVNSNRLEFTFDNIDLPFDDNNNDGYIAFKIKTRSTLVNGDSFSNTAKIYFDYNLPIITNTATTTFAVLENPDFEFSNYFRIYPNPASDTLNLANDEKVEINNITIYNLFGQPLITLPNSTYINTINITSLPQGTYFIAIDSSKGRTNTKFVKK